MTFKLTLTHHLLLLLANISIVSYISIRNLDGLKISQENNDYQLQRSEWGGRVRAETSMPVQLPEVSNIVDSHSAFRLQLVSSNWKPKDLIQVFDCLDLIGELQGGHYRDSSRLMMEHMIGTASCAAHAGFSAELVCVALLHSLAFTKWNTGRPDIVPGGTPKDICKGRQLIRNRVGAEIEERAWQFNLYSHETYKVFEMIDLGLQLDNFFTKDDIDLIKLALCDEAEDSVNGIQWWGLNVKSRGAAYIDMVVSLADRLGDGYLKQQLLLGYNWTRVAFPSLEWYDTKLVEEASPGFAAYKPVFEHVRKVTMAQSKFQWYTPTEVYKNFLSSIILNETLSGADVLKTWHQDVQAFMDYCKEE